MKVRIFAIVVVTAAIIAVVMLEHHTAAATSIGVRSKLPSNDTAKRVLESTMRHREWVTVPAGPAEVQAFIVYPGRSNKAPVVLVSGDQQGASDWVRAVSDQVAAEGFIAVVPDLGQMSSDEIARRTTAVRRYALSLPAANGIGATLVLDTNQARVNSTSFRLNEQSWPRVIEYLSKQTGNKPAETDTDDHSAHIAEMIAMAQPAGRGPQAAAPAGGGPGYKAPNLPAPYFVAQSTLASSKLKNEWVDIPVGDAKLHTLIVYPEGNAPAGVVIAMQHGTGLDYWMRAVADQLAVEGFIAVAPDIWSGLGPDGGGWDSFEFIDDGVRAAGRVTADETLRRYQAARDYAMKLPRANGKSASLGFCAGGGNSFRFAGEVPQLNAAVVFYGPPPDEATMAKINAPVLGLYGENDARITSTVEATTATMKRLGKFFEPHVYPKATHSFVLFQDVGGNPAAVADAWPRAMIFLKRYMR